MCIRDRPGIYLNNDKDWGTNPCCEIGLRPYQFCNLTEVNVSNVESQEDLNERMRGAAFIGTLQAGYTEFHYLRRVWQRTTEKDALLGIGMTGIGSGRVQKLDLEEAAEMAVSTNKYYASEFGKFNVRTNCIAPGLIRTDFARALWENPEILKSALTGTPQNRIGEPDELGGAAVFLASAAGSYVNGHTIVVDGGTTV